MKMQRFAWAWMDACRNHWAPKTPQTLSNALISHLRGLYVLMGHETFYPLPAMTVTRSIAEVASSLSWMLHPGSPPMLDPRAATQRSSRCSTKA